MKKLIPLIIVLFSTQYSTSQKVSFEQISQDSILKITGTLSKNEKNSILDIFIGNLSEHPILIPKIQQMNMSRPVSDSLFSLSLNYSEDMWDHYIHR